MALSRDQDLHLKHLSKETEIRLEDSKQQECSGEGISTVSPAGVTPELEHRVTRKFDRRILPLVFLIYLCSYLDRSNIGNAVISGLSTDLNLVGTQFNTALALFYVFYIIVDLPAALLLKWIGPRYLLGVLTTCWGICAMCMGFVKTSIQLYALRSLLGLLEGGLTSCLFVYLALFYRKYQMNSRVAWMFTAAPISGAIGGLLATALGKISFHGLNSWPWIFIGSKMQIFNNSLY